MKLFHEVLDTYVACQVPHCAKMSTSVMKHPCCNKDFTTCANHRAAAEEAFAEGRELTCASCGQRPAPEPMWRVLG